jgi:hypothetical protein
MPSSSSIDVARRFLSVAWEGPPPVEADLIEVLDHLVAAIHDTPGGRASEWEAPREDLAILVERAHARFPDLGLYPCADPLDAPGSGAVVALNDAIDDIVDITRDMREVIWVADRIGADDANFQFRLLFSHWGTHARDLLRYLHARHHR